MVAQDKKDPKAGKEEDGAAEPAVRTSDEIDRVQAKKRLSSKVQKRRTAKTREDVADPKRAKEARKRKSTSRRVRKGEESARDIGVDIPAPPTACDDDNCPFHGNLPLRGQSLDVVVVSDRMARSAVVQRQLSRTHPKYERQLKITHRYLVHNPDCIAAKPGEMVRIMECRPISKKKSFAIIGRL